MLAKVSLRSKLYLNFIVLRNSIALTRTLLSRAMIIINFLHMKNFHIFILKFRKKVTLRVFIQGFAIRITLYKTANV